MTTEVAFITGLATGVVALWSLFLLPSLVALQRRHPRRWAVFSVNLLLGATGVGWLGALIWALRAPLPFVLATTALWPTPTVDISAAAKAARLLRSSDLERKAMSRIKILLTGIGSAAILVALSIAAYATMPVLTTLPKQPTVAACQKWAASQSSDAIEMWSTQISGKPSREVGLMRLTLSCMGDEEPEIVGFYSSIGVADAFCEKHKSANICKSRQ